MGSANAAVFPVPVCAVPITSRPLRIGGIQPRCTGVGFVIPSAITFELSHWLSPSARKEASPPPKVAVVSSSGVILPDSISPTFESELPLTRGKTCPIFPLLGLVDLEKTVIPSSLTPVASPFASSASD